MAAKPGPILNHDKLLSMIPAVVDFLDLDSEEIISSGILDDDRLDDAAIAMILDHARRQNKASVSDQTCTDFVSKTLSNLFYSKPADPAQSESAVSTNLMDTFRSRFRMTEAMFEALLQDVMELTSFSKRKPADESASKEQVAEQLPMSPSSMLMLTLRFLGCQQPAEQLATELNVSEEVFSQVLHETMEALYDLLQYYVLWPDASQVADSCGKFQDMCGLQGVLGIIDALHIQVKAPAEHTDYYTNQQKETTVVLQTVCDHQLRFLHCCTGWPGSMDERTVLKDSDLHTDVREQSDTYFPSNSYLAGDDAYPLTSWLLTPFSENSDLNTAEQQFNSALKLLLQNNLMVYSLLLKRFPRLEHVEMRDMQSMVVTILVCCALHNFCVDRGDTSLFDDAEVTVRSINTIAESDICAASEIERKEGENRRNIVVEQLFAKV